MLQGGYSGLLGLVRTLDASIFSLAVAASRTVTVLANPNMQQDCDQLSSFHQHLQDLWLSDFAPPGLVPTYKVQPKPQLWARSGALACSAKVASGPCSCASGGMSKAGELAWLDSDVPWSLESGNLQIQDHHICRFLPIS